MKSFYKFLKNNHIFCDLTEQELQQMLKISQKITVPKGVDFIHEGELAENLYFILNGTVAIIKSDQNNQSNHVIAHLNSGNMIGEIALLDHETRSASARAETAVTLISISFADLKELCEKSPSFNKILLRISENITRLIRQTDINIVAAMEKQLYEQKMRTKTAVFMVYMIVMLCLYTFFIAWESDHNYDDTTSTILTVPLAIIFSIFFFFIMKNSELPRQVFGFTTQNWRQAVTEGILFTLIVCIGVVVLKWLLILTTTNYMNHAIFEPFSDIRVQKSSGIWNKYTLWWIVFILYWLIIVPMQEIITRGSLQGTLEVFLTGKFRSLIAILVSNLMFATTHLFMSISISFMVFFVGLYLGWLYSRHHTLIGVILAHGLLGTWALMIVGLRA